MKTKNNKIIISILVAGIILLSQYTSSLANIASGYYKVDNEKNIISRIEPETTIKVFKEKIGEYDIYKDKEKTQKVDTGLVGTGMYLETKEKCYEISVVGDFDGDGKATQVELTNIIRHIVGLEGAELEGIKYESADLTGDGLVDQRDITKYIRYIVYGELDLGKIDTTGPEVKLSLINKTSNKISVEASAIDKESGMEENTEFIFYVKKKEETEYKEVQRGTKSTLEITELEQNTEYEIKVETQDKAGNKGQANIEVKTEIISNGMEQGAIIFGETVWENNMAETTISTNTKYDIEYQLNGTNGKWIKGKYVTGLKHGDILYARLTDGTNHGNYASITIIDEIAPILEIITSSGTSQITATVTSIDNESGIYENEEYVYYIKEAKEPDSSYEQIQSTTNKTYTFTGLKQNTDYTIKVEIKDKAGNIGIKETSETTEKISDGTEAGSIIFSNITWTNGQAEVIISTNTQYIIEYQVNGIEGNWVKAILAGGDITAKGLNHNDIIYARLTDGTTEGNYTTLTILDTIKPNITLSLQTENQEINAIVDVKDYQTGIDENTKYKFFIKETGELDNTYVEKQNTTNNECKFTGLTVGKNYTIKVEVADRAGNIGIIEKSILIPDDVAPIVTLTQIAKSSNTVTVEAKATDEGGLPNPVIYVFYIKETGASDSTYVEISNKEVNQCTFRDLKQNKEYTVKVEVADLAGNIGKKELSILTSKIPDATEAGAINFNLIKWTNGQAEVEVSTNTNYNYQIEYQVNGTNSSWTQVPLGIKQTTVTGLNHNDVIYARLTDGINSSNSATLTVIDGNKPTVTLNAVSNKSSEIIATAEAIDNETGIDENATYVFYIKEQGGTYLQKQNTTSKTCIFTGLNQNKDYTIKVEVADRAENVGIKETSIKTKAIPDAVTTKSIIFSSIIWNNGQAEVTISTNAEYYIEYQVNGTENIWTKANTVGESVTVTGLKNNDVIYARLTDGVNGGNYAILTVIDTIKPQEFTISVTDITETGFTVIGSTDDKETGIRDYTYVIEKKGEIKVSESSNTKAESNNINCVSYNNNNTVDISRSFN